MTLAGAHGTRDAFCLLGSTVADTYRVESVAGQDRLGVVYRALELGSRLEVALTCLNVPSELDALTRSQIARSLLRETLLTHRLAPDGNAIVPVLTVATLRSRCQDWFPYVVREWLYGEPLAEHAARERHRPPLDWLLALLEPAALALARAHDFRFAHAALTPDHMFVARRGNSAPRLVLLDFGVTSGLLESPRLLAALGSEGARRLIDARYAAPERLDPRYGAIGPWTDVFSFALIVSELWIGRPALEGRHPLEWTIAAANPLRRPTPRTLGSDASVPDHIEHALTRALAPDPSARFPTLGSFWSALTR
jgi:serine/threonine-protein kinase